MNRENTGELKLFSYNELFSLAMLGAVEGIMVTLEKGNSREEKEEIRKYLEEKVEFLVKEGWRANERST